MIAKKKAAPKKKCSRGSERARKQLKKAAKKKKRVEKKVAKSNAAALPKATVRWKVGAFYLGKETKTQIVPSEPKAEVFKVLEIRKDGIRVEPTVIGGELVLPVFYKAREAMTNADKALVARARKAHNEYRAMKAEIQARTIKPKSPTAGYTQFVRQQFIDGPITNDEVLKRTLKQYPDCTEKQVKNAVGGQKWHAQKAGYTLLKMKIGKDSYYILAAEGEIKDKQKKFKKLTA